MRCVAVTGLGVVSEVGLQTTAFFESLLAESSGIRCCKDTFPIGPEQVLMGSIDFHAEEHISKANS